MDDGDFFSFVKQKAPMDTIEPDTEQVTFIDLAPKGEMTMW